MVVLHCSCKVACSEGENWPEHEQSDFHFVEGYSFYKKLLGPKLLHFFRLKRAFKKLVVKNIIHQKALGSKLLYSFRLKFACKKLVFKKYNLLKSFGVEVVVFLSSTMLPRNQL
jgi:hypothetical protein